MRTFGWVLGGIALVLLVWWLWPSRVDPAYWDELDPPELTGVLEPDGALAAAGARGEGLIASSEDIALAPGGGFYTGQPDGTLMWVSESGREARVVAQVTNNRPVLGLQWHPEGRLIAAASDGVYAINVDSGAVELISNGPAYRPFGFADDLDIAADGTIYVTDASWRWPNGNGEPSFQYDMAENRPYGLFYALQMDGTIDLLQDDLYFANGVAMASDGQSVFVIETFRYRLSRYWIEGPRAGEWEIVADNLPGIPDGVTGDGTGRLYIAMDTQRVPLLTFLHRNPFLTRMITKLPEFVWLRAGPPRAFILVVDEQGNHLDSWHDPDGRWGMIANVVPDGEGRLYLGSLTEPRAGVFVIP
ncbi:MULTISPECIES: SMP-30/gluconolactonase/LRE family protein [Hyphobacterium]|uniref:SMP-30/gluconolactonase/LRE family protein n=1 Tax=Hyphobacterium vulgare TaxID=1736751 RepID=A0ABV6ZZ11_9PROT